MLAEERLNDNEEAIRAALDGRQATIWTSLPGIIESYDPVAMTAVVQPSIQYTQRAKDGTLSLVTLPLCVDCPVQFPGGGGFFFSYRLVKGDECLISFAQRCIDAWWQNGDVQPQAEFRMHDPSDGFVIPGFFSQPRVLTPVTPAGVAEIRNAARTVRVSAHSNGLLDFVNASGSIRLETNGNATVSGNLQVNGTFTFGDGSKKIVLDGDPVSAGVVHATTTKGFGQV